jgi:hypothetical protein
VADVYLELSRPKENEGFDRGFFGFSLHTICSDSVIYTEGPFGLQKNKKIPFYIKNKRKI